MPKYKSIDGVWTAEDVAAKEVLKERGVDHLGIPVKLDPEVHSRAARMGKTVDEYINLYSNANKSTLTLQEGEIKESKKLLFPASKPSNK